MGTRASSGRHVSAICRHLTEHRLSSSNTARNLTTTAATTTGMRAGEALPGNESTQAGEGAEAASGGRDEYVQLVPAGAFYRTYHGHEVRWLEQVHEGLRGRCGKEEIVWFAGDSTLDNKYWFDDRVHSGNGYEAILDNPSRAKPDVAYWVNHELEERGIPTTACINTSVEATTLGQREGQLTEQDVFLRDHLHANDTLVCSIGGNDIAMAPTPITIAKMLWLTTFSSRANISNGTAAGLSHFIDIFGLRTQRYLEQLISKTKPRRVIVCMLYFIDEDTSVDSWASMALSALGYNKDPSLLQLLIRTMYQRATSHIQLDGVEVLPLPLFETLDGKSSSDYEQRVEPSPAGGRKMAAAIVDRMQ